ncbi:MAG: hypothetical protein ABIS59_01405 [Candidatus Saccharibacteria bacterium]
MASKKNQKLVQEIVILFVVMALIGGYFIYTSRAKTPKVAPTQKTSIDTTFDANALNKLQQKDNTYPDVSPTAGDLGKTDPYSK